MIKILILLVFFLSNIILGNKWYVSTSSSGNGSGSSWANKRILSNFNWTQVQPGDTVFIDGGSDSLVYTSSSAFAPNCSGTSGNPITITKGVDAGHNGKPVFYGSGIVVASFEYNYITVNNMQFMPNGTGGNGYQVIHIQGNDVTIQNCTIYYNVQKAMRVEGNNVKILSNLMDTGNININGATDGMWIGNGGHSLEVAYNSILMRNIESGGNHKDIIQSYLWQTDNTGTTKIHHNFFYSARAGTTANTGLELGGIGGNFEIYDNIFVYGGSGSGRVLYMGNCREGVSNRFTARIYNNTFYIPDAEYFGIMIDDTDSLSFKNNIVYNPTGIYNSLLIGDVAIAGVLDINYNQYVKASTNGFLYQWPCSGNAESYTFAQWKTNYGQDANSEFFTNGTSIDFVGTSFPSLMPSDYALEGSSTGINEGVQLPSNFSTDYNGNARTWVWDVGAFEFVESTLGYFQLVVEINDGWNMVSTPGLHPINQNVTTWWSGKDPASGVFKFAGGYQSVTTTTPGQGYWMKHIGTKTYSTGDEWPLGGIKIVPVIPNPVASGWNMIGGYHYAIPKAGITTAGGSLIGSIFKYSNGYLPVDTLKPGYGYSIKMSAAGTIIFPSPTFKSLAKPVETDTKDWGKVIITDNSGKSYTLYIVKGEVNLNDYELPPAPPEGMFDVRYGSGRYAEELSAVNQSIELNSLEYPVKVRVENADIRIQDGTGNGLNERLKSGEEVTISNSSINKLMVSGEIVPDKYALEQNYPNPFNSSSIIKYSIPKSSQVTLKIFNTLGEEIATLVNEEKLAGTYELKWNASNLPSGVYFYSLLAGNFVQTRKMILLK